MKKFKRIASFLLAMVMILAMSCTVFAAEDTDPSDSGESNSSSIPFPDAPRNPGAESVKNHEYAVYQIFSGTQNEDSDDLLNIGWGNDVKAEEFLAALKGSTVIGSFFSDIQYSESEPNKSADAVARVIAKQQWGDDSTQAKEFAYIAQQYKKGTGTPLKGDDGKTVALAAGYYLVVDTQVGDDDENAVVNRSMLQLTKAHDFEITVKADVPALEKKVKEVNDSTGEAAWQDVADFDIEDEVEFVLTATLPSNYADYKTYKYVFHDKLSAGLSLIANSVKVYIDGELVNKTADTTPETGDSLTVTFADLKKEYPDVTADSVIRVVYSAKLTGDAVVIGGDGNENEAYLEYSNDPNHKGEGDEEPPTGNTPKDKVVVFTFELIANKTDESGKALEGAEFTLSKKTGVDAEGKAVYTLVKTLAGTKTGEGDAVKVSYDFSGIDAGEYKLEETKVPAGYNKAEDMYFTVVAEYDEATPPNMTKIEIASVNDANGNQIVDASGKPTFSFTPSISDGSLTTDIVNQKGLLLPSTGGIGTTIFYIVGGILVVGAGILLVTKKRMKSR